MFTIVLVIFLVMINISVIYRVIGEKKFKSNKFMKTLEDIFKEEDEDEEDDNELNKVLSLKESCEALGGIIEVNFVFV